MMNELVYIYMILARVRALLEYVEKANGTKHNDDDGMLFALEWSFFEGGAKMRAWPMCLLCKYMREDVCPSVGHFGQTKSASARVGLRH